MRTFLDLSLASLTMLILFIQLPDPARAQSTSGGLGSLTEFLPATGRDNVWRYANTGDSFEIENIGDPLAIQYFYVGPEAGTEGRRRLEVELSVHQESNGSAGLLYGLNDARDLYHLLTLDASGMITIFRRDGSGFRPMLEQSSSAFLPGKINRLTIQETGDEIGFSLNGTSLGSIGGDLFGFGSVGLAAVGDVRAFFNHFSVETDGDRSDLPQIGQTPGTRPVSTPFETLRMQPVQIMDAQGPAGQMVAYETLIPDDWITRGGVMWSPQDGPNGCFTGARLIWGAGTEDDRYGLVFLDPMSWGMSTIGPSRYMCLPQDLTDAETAMRAYFEAISGMMQVSVRDVQRPAYLQPLIDVVAQSWATDLQMARTWVDGVAITASVTADGTTSDAYIIAITKHIETQFDQATTFRDGRTALVLAALTPSGELEKGHPAFAQILNNLRVNPQWKQIEAQWWAEKLRRPTPQPTAGSPAADSSVGDMMFESWKRREGIKDAGQARSVNGIWEVQPWQTSSGSTVLLNQNYNHAWELGNGSIVLTNDANFSPMQSYNQTGSEMQRNN